MAQSPFFSFVRPLAVVAFGGIALLRPGDPATTAAQFARAREAALEDFPIAVYYAFKQSESDEGGPASTVGDEIDAADHAHHRGGCGWDVRDVHLHRRR